MLFPGTTKMTSKFYASWKIPGTFYAVNNITNNKTTEKETSVRLTRDECKRDIDTKERNKISNTQSIVPLNQ